MKRLIIIKKSTGRMLLVVGLWALGLSCSGGPATTKTVTEPTELTMVDIAQRRVELAKRELELARNRLTMLRLEVAETDLMLAEIRAVFEHEAIGTEGLEEDVLCSERAQLKQKELLFLQDIVPLYQILLLMHLHDWNPLDLQQQASIANAVSELETEIPEFPWPPPKASSFLVLPSKFLRKRVGEMKRLRDVDEEIRSALESCEYFGRSYYAVPDGFAIITQLEQINRNGTSKGLPDRWATEVQPLRRFSLVEYIRALITANRGFYRTIVFVISPHPFSQIDASVSLGQTMAWLLEGSNVLPDTIAELEYSEAYECTALVYEFEKYPGEEAVTKIPGHLTAKEHLDKAKIWKALED